MAETQTVEVFDCPECGQDNYVEWGAKEKSREIACSRHGVVKSIDQPMTDDKGNPIVVPLVYNEGYQFAVKRQAGKRGAVRELSEIGSWIETASAVIGKAEV